ncbi:hypothetical protein Poly30_25200 [Planctomycetes bacterium Poly30]|uniref:Uncharacterized protein n=1 Tax=Saltatorellus ferox TaxID=2528018 RepID=A0A518ESD0_9BACT|nr:hypothetical protein Poly30_25200 [Planctomycetes bacterium Poly30]
MRDDSARDEFFIGWQAEGPPRTMRFVRARVLWWIALALGVAVLAAISQRPFASSNFEFGAVRTFEGVLEHVPFPVLVVDRPAADPAGPSTSRWLLTVFGKRGAEPHTRPFDGARVRLKGSLIHRDDAVMVELLPETLAVLEERSARADDASAATPITLRGEIVDSKCFLGVMKPGNLKTHRACAARCISGGVPPVLLVRDESGRATYFLLVGPAGEAVNERVLPYVAEPIEVTGSVSTRGDLRILRADPEAFRRL